MEKLKIKQQNFNHVEIGIEHSAFHFIHFSLLRVDVIAVLRKTIKKSQQTKTEKPHVCIQVKLPPNCHSTAAWIPILLLFVMQTNGFRH